MCDPEIGNDVLATICSSRWIGAEGSRNGRPLLIRARYVPEALVGSPNLPELLVLTYSYQPLDDSGLPSQEQYDDITRLESDPIDAIESQRVGVVTVIRTCGGSVRYFCYVRNIHEASAVISARLRSGDSVEFAGDEDPAWAEYCRLIRMIAEWPTTKGVKAT